MQLLPCGEGAHFHANCCAPSDHPGVISNAKFYPFTLQTERRRFKAQAEEQMRKPGWSKSTEKTSNNKEHGINHIDTAFLFNKTASKMKIFSATNPHIALLGTWSLVTALRRADLLSDLRILDNELLVFGNNEGSKVESIGHLGVIRNVKVLRNLANIIISVYGLQLLNWDYFS